jgi:endonuclease/exonuclease/phosphatase family metal-dependent hydrolase
VRFNAHALLVLGCALFVTGCASLREEKGSTRLKVMTYNIRIGASGREWHSDPARINLEPIAKVITSFSPDIVGLQEVDRFRKRTGLMNQPALLSQRLGMHIAFEPAYSVSIPSGTNEDYGNALLSRFPIATSNRLPLFKPDYSKSHPRYPDYYSEQRAVLHGQLTINDRTVHVFVTHLGLTADQREKQITEIAELAARYPGPKIIMGDFNATPDEPAMKILRATFKDVLEEAGLPIEQRFSFPGGTNPVKAIDYIFVSPEFHVLNAKVIRDETLASDHNPVIAEIELR